MYEDKLAWSCTGGFKGRGSVRGSVRRLWGEERSRGKETAKPAKEIEIEIEMVEKEKSTNEMLAKAFSFLARREMAAAGVVTLGTVVTSRTC